MSTLPNLGLVGALASADACSVTELQPEPEHAIRSNGEGPVYEANWESLAQRPMPAWFEDAKLGIFIHGGPYFVPVWHEVF